MIFQMSSTTALVTFITVIVIGIVNLGVMAIRKHSIPAIIAMGALTAIGLGDFYFVVTGGVNSSLSAFFARWTHTQLPPLSFFIFMMGAVVSHLLWGMYPQPKG